MDEERRPYRLDLLGAQVGFRARPEDLEAVRQILPSGDIGPCSEDEPGVRWLDGEHSGHILGSALRMAVAESSSDAVFVHAGAVAVGGRGIVLPGPSGAGKSTLTEALVRGGAEYFSDEFAVIREGGSLHPLPSWLSMRLPGGDRFVDPAIVGRVAHEAVPVAVVALAVYEGDRPVSVETFHGGSAVLAVLGHTLSLRTHPASTMRRVRELTERARVVAMERGEVDAAIDRLLELAASA